MSGGSMGYLCYQIEEHAVGEMCDVEMDEMMRDLAQLLHDLEWWRSGDYGEDAYRERVAAFKARWLGGGACRRKRLMELVEKRISEVRKEMVDMIGGGGDG